MLRRRAPPPLRSIGQEPDPRFTLANERTFLAQIRTALALVASGLAVVEFLESEPRTLRLAIGLPLMLLGAGLAMGSYRRWESVERALRLNHPLPYASVSRYVGMGIGVVALAACALVVVHP